MTKSTRTKISFSDILNDLEEANSRRLLAKAVLANQVAKVAVSGAGRRAAYARKTAALLRGIEQFPREYRLARVERDGQTLAINYRGRAALHLPVESVEGEGARRWLARERTRLTVTNFTFTPNTPAALELAA